MTIWEMGIPDFDFRLMDPLGQVILIIILLVTMGCELPNDTIEHQKLIGDTVDVRAMKFYPSGEILSVYHQKDGVKHGQETEYFASGGKKSEGVWYRGFKTGWFRYFFENGKLRTLREYIILDHPDLRERVSYPNQIINFDEHGDSLSTGSFYIRLQKTSDTIVQGTPFYVRVTLVEPMFDEMYVILCDKDYPPSSSEVTCDTFGVKNYRLIFSPRSSHLGENIIEGMVVNFENYIDEGGRSKSKSATIYFSLSYYITK